MRINFWGTRGSIPKAGPGTVRYGGNTSCVEVRAAGGTVVVLDCGTGAHSLGHALIGASEGPLHGHILITHTHWDHIQGIPFFAPLFAAGNEWDIYAPRGLERSIRETLAGQMQYTYFPITLEQFGATIRYHDLVEGTFDIGSIRVTTRYLNHPALTLGYRMEADGVVVVYATDHEPHSRQLAAGRGYIGGEDRQHVNFLAEADLVIHDAQYSADEYPTKVGWGHSTVEYATEVARSAGVRRLALFHHDPLRDDEALDRLVETARGRLAASGASVESLELFAAAEGIAIELERSVPASFKSRGADISVVTSPPRGLLEHSVLVAVTDPTTGVTLSDAVREDGFRLLVATDGASALRIARSEERPALIILERHLPGCDGIEVCRALRGDEGSYGSDVPIIMFSTKEDPIDMQAASDAGVTDWLIKPVSATYARTRVRAWALRTTCRWSRAPLPKDEEERVRALRRLSILDTWPEERFDRLTRLAAALLDVPIALISLVDVDRQWFKSSYGLGVRQTPREVAFCAHAILGEDILVVSDALLDPRFADNPVVTGDPHVRFYAGVPLTVAGGSRVGTLCLVDHRPRELDDTAKRLLRDLGTLVERELSMTSRD